MEKSTEKLLSLIRGHKDDGSFPMYSSVEFLHLKDQMQWPQTLHSVVSEANRRVSNDVGLFRSDAPLTHEEVVEFLTKGEYNGIRLGRDDFNVKIFDEEGRFKTELETKTFQKMPSLSVAYLRAVDELCVYLGMEKPEYYPWGNPTNITAFFPGTWMHDYNHPFWGVRKGTFRIENAQGFIASPGLSLVKHRVGLEGMNPGLQITANLPFTWEAIARDGVSRNDVDQRTIEKLR